MDEQNKPEPENNKPGFFKRLFEDLYEVTVIDSKNRKHVFMMKEISKRTNTMIKGRDQLGRKFEYSTPEPFTYKIKKLY